MARLASSITTLQVGLGALSAFTVLGFMALAISIGVVLPQKSTIQPLELAMFAYRNGPPGSTFIINPNEFVITTLPDFNATIANGTNLAGFAYNNGDFFPLSNTSGASFISLDTAGRLSLTRPGYYSGNSVITILGLGQDYVQTCTFEMIPPFNLPNHLTIEGLYGFPPRVSSTYSTVQPLGSYSSYFEFFYNGSLPLPLPMNYNCYISINKTVFYNFVFFLQITRDPNVQQV